MRRKKRLTFIKFKQMDVQSSRILLKEIFWKGGGGGGGTLVV